MSMFRNPAPTASRVRSLSPSSSRPGIGGPLRGVELEVVALEEDRRAPALAQRGGQDDGGVLGRALVGVGHLALGDLEDDGRRIALERGRERLSRGQVGRGAHVDGRHGEARGVHLAAAAGAVQLVDRGRSAAQRLRRAPDHPARRIAHGRIVLEDRLEGELVHELLAEAALVGHLEAVIGDRGDTGQAGAQVVGGDGAHAPILAKGRYEREGEEWRDQQAEPADQQVPVSRGALVGHAAAAEAGGPPANGRQAGHVQERRQADHADGERAHPRAVAEGEDATRRARCGKLEADDERGSADDDRRPGQVGEERPVQRRASSPLRRAASSASRRVMRLYSKYR